VLQVHLAQSPYQADPEPWLGGWVSTQDLVTVHPTTGALRLRGRVDSGGDHHADVDLLEIERVLHAHRHVHEAVVLCTDPIEAHVVGSPALAQLDLVAWCRGVLGDTRAPARCHVVPALPRTVNGKYLRNRELIRTARATPS
jgi:acyl-coenzyme A synthetase/AMP-(fatty) acid ligase